MIFISGIISLIIQKNMLCKNKIRVIYFCQFIFLNFFFFIINIFLEGVTATFHPLPSSALTTDHALNVEYYVGRYFHFLNNLNCSTASVILKLPFYKFGKYFSIFPLGFLRQHFNCKVFMSYQGLPISYSCKSTTNHNLIQFFLYSFLKIFHRHLLIISNRKSYPNFQQATNDQYSVYSVKLCFHKTVLIFLQDHLARFPYAFIAVE